jgi:hypothetical protein
MGVNRGAGLSSLLVLFSATFCAGSTAVATGVVSDVTVATAFVSGAEESEASSAILCFLAFDFAGVLAKPAGISHKTSVNSAPLRKIDRVIAPNLHHRICFQINLKEAEPLNPLLANKFLPGVQVATVSSPRPEMKRQAGGII